MSAGIDYIRGELEQLLETSLLCLKDCINSRDSLSDVMYKYGRCIGYRGALVCLPGSTFRNKDVMEFLDGFYLCNLKLKEIRAIKFPDINVSW